MAGGARLDRDAVIRFCRERAAGMKSPLTAAIYSGMADRVSRGFFDEKEAGDDRTA